MNFALYHLHSFIIHSKTKMHAYIRIDYQVLCTNLFTHTLYNGVLCNRGSKKLEIIYPYFLHLIFKQKAVYTCILCMNYYIKHLYTTCRIRTAVFFRVCQLMHEEERSFFPQLRSLPRIYLSLRVLPHKHVIPNNNITVIFPNFSLNYV